MKDIKLVALDLDGTLFDNSSRISKRNLTAIRSITDKGIHVVISTGRPFEGIPFDQIKGTGINYAITANGSGIYEISTGKCLYENAMDEELVTPILNFLLTRDIHMDAFIGGKGYTPIQCVETAQKLTVPSSIKNYIITTRTRLDNILQFIHENQLKVQKMTLNFYPAAEWNTPLTAKPSANFSCPIRHTFHRIYHTLYSALQCSHCDRGRNGYRIGRCRNCLFNICRNLCHVLGTVIQCLCSPADWDIITTKKFLSTTRRSLSRSGIVSFAYIQSPLSRYLFQ